MPATSATIVTDEGGCIPKTGEFAKVWRFLESFMSPEAVGNRLSISAFGRILPNIAKAYSELGSIVQLTVKHHSGEDVSQYHQDLAEWLLGATPNDLEKLAILKRELANNKKSKHDTTQSIVYARFLKHIEQTTGRYSVELLCQTSHFFVSRLGGRRDLVARYKKDGLLCLEHLPTKACLTADLSGRKEELSDVWKRLGLNNLQQKRGLR